MKEGLEDRVFVDLDADDISNIIFIDVTQHLDRNFQDTKEWEGSSCVTFQDVIILDDDDENYDDDDCEDYDFRGFFHSRGYEDSGDDDCQFVCERKVPFRRSKCRRFYSCKQADSDLSSTSGSSTSYSSDCEITVREGWENACLKRRCTSGDSRHEESGKSVSVESSLTQPSSVEIGSNSEETAADPSFIVNGREKLKDTVEYKKAVEEEWESRQQQLRIQAEEARRLRMRKRAKATRLEDMTKRQKLRVEQVREAQKKDEEEINVKEQLRGQLRVKLSTMEGTCTDMASLLRCLGIPVAKHPKPSAHEVHAAYKRALLRFHPDRVSNTDIAQQVEAEERFKLICRMKEKLLPS